MSQFLSRVSRNCELPPWDIAAHTVAKDGRSRVEECVQWKVCTGMPLDRLGNTLGPQLTALGDVEIWPIFRNTYHRCDSICEVHGWVKRTTQALRCRLLPTNTRHNANRDAFQLKWMLLFPRATSYFCPSELRSGWRIWNGKESGRGWDKM